MLRLAEGRGNAPVMVVEEPRDVVARLGRLDIANANLAPLLEPLGPQGLRALERHTQAALRLHSGRDGGNGEAAERTSPILKRDTRITD